MVPLAILLGIAIWINGATVAAIQGGWARRLDLPGAWLTPYAPWVALVFFVLAVTAIIKFKVRWRWVWFIAAYVLGTFISGFPFFVMESAKRISLGAPLTRESKQAFEAKYPVKWVSDGRGIFVRSDDYSPELAAFVTGLVENQVKPGEEKAGH